MNALLFNIFCGSVIADISGAIATTLKDSNKAVKITRN
jgi:hypothetical protein